MPRRKRLLILPLYALLLCLVSPLFAESFRNPLLLPTAGDPLGVAAADLNGDGKLDLVYTTGSSSVQTLHVMLGRGDGTFAPGVEITLPPYVCGCFINVADVTGDGKLDIILSGNDAEVLEVAVLPGHGDGTFAAAVLTSSPPGNGSYPVAGQRLGIGDLNGDGAVDLVIADLPNDKMYVLLGNNTGSFTFGPAIFSGYYPGPLYLADLNGDGYLDLVAYGLPSQSAVVYPGHGDGTFGSGTAYPVSVYTSNVILADVNGDGHPDLVDSLYTGEVDVLTGKSDGTFAAATALNQSVPNGLVVEAADYTGGAEPDLLLINLVGVAVMPETGSLAYGPPVSSLAGAGTINNTVGGDFNGDGHRDVAMGVEGGIALLLGKGDGGFKSGDSYDVGQPVGSTAIADFNGDHHADIAVATTSAQPQLLLGDGSGLFTLGAGPGTGTATPAYSMVTADFDGDGHPDLDALLTTGFGIYFGTASGAFSAPLAVPFGSQFTADVNGDGRADMVTIDSDSGRILVQLGQANQTFVQVTTPLRYPEFAALRALGDVNNDGRVDLVLSDFNGDEVWLGNGDGTFTYSNTLPVTPASPIGYEGPAPGAIADIDGDGKPDLVLVSASLGAPLAAVLWGNGDATFQAPVMLTLSHVYGTVELADVNGDGRPDLVLSDGVGIAVIESQPGRTFAQEDHYLAGSSIATFSLADVNGDGYPDLVAADNHGTTVAVLLNQPNGIPPGGEHLAATLAVAPEPSAFGQSATVTFKLTGASGGPAPTGTVSFSVDGVLAGSPAVAGGVASLKLSSTLSSGTHTVTASYNGDSTYGAAVYQVQHTVSPALYTSTTVLTATPGTALASQTIRLLAAVTSTGSQLGGTVTFLDGSQTIGSGLLDLSGHTLLDTNLLQAGTHTLTATYIGRNLAPLAIYEPSTSAAVTVVISATTTTTTLSASTGSPTVGAVVTFTAAVASSSGMPFGGVSFFDGATLLGTSSVTGGSASFSTGLLSAGSHTITATYHANGTYGGSTGSESVTVAQASASLARTLTSLSLGAGNMLTAQVLTDAGAPWHGVQGTVTFLDCGVLLGTVPVSSDGTASVALGSSGSAVSGTHTLYAGFAGGAAAPSISPPLVEQGSPGGSALSLAPAGNSLTLQAGGSASMTLEASGPPGAVIAFSCGNAAQAGVVCSFSPEILTGAGATVLSVERAGREASVPFGRSGSKPGGSLGVVAAALVALCVLRPRRLQAAALLLLCCAGLGALTGCGSRVVRTSQASATVLVVQASSGAGASALSHAVQVVVVAR